ncbi:Hypothetical protein PBC10988_19010 [Planctomycetales bacterium 10988]|nr:Hypothetical protein PBC10988_19010 [Planctomycetales bacterium 10988]
MIVLDILKGPDANRRIAVNANPFLFGRAEDCHLRLAHDSVSRQHCQIEFTGGVAVIQDLESTNGTLVNGRLLQDFHPVCDEDLITIGPWEIMICYEEAGSSYGGKADHVLGDESFEEDSSQRAQGDLETIRIPSLGELESIYSEISQKESSSSLQKQTQQQVKQQTTKKWGRFLPSWLRF